MAQQPPEEKRKQPEPFRHRTGLVGSLTVLAAPAAGFASEFEDEFRPVTPLWSVDVPSGCERPNYRVTRHTHS